MLVQFKFKNHKCFYDETILDFTATEEKRHCDNLINKNGIKLLPVIAIHGANASGKTTVLDALSFMFYNVRTSIHTDIQKDLLVFPFIFSEKAKKEDSEFEISINIDDYEYRYGFALNKKMYTEEWLYRKPFNSTTKASEKLIFERQKNKVKFGRSYTKHEKIWNLYESEIDSKKLLILSHIAMKEEKGFFRDIYEFMNNFSCKIDTTLNKLSIEILNNDTEIHKKFKELLNEFDPFLLDVKIDYIEDGEEKNKVKISGIHKNIDNPKQNILIPFENESFGTIKIFNVLPSVLVSLEIGSLVCVDELDVKLHPLLFKKIVSMYNDSDINKNNAQLVFTSHSTYLFKSKYMRRDQLYLTEKNKDGKSELFSLSDFKNLRGDADYEKKYLAGQFGAIPYME